MQTCTDEDVQVIEATPAQGRAIFDKAARESLRISGDEFLTRWDAGEYEDSDDLAVTQVAMLIPFVR